MCIHLKVSNSWLETALESEVGDRLTVGLIFMAARKEVNIESSMLDWTGRHGAMANLTHKQNLIRTPR